MSVSVLRSFHGHQFAEKYSNNKSAFNLTKVDDCKLCDYYSNNLKQLNTCISETLELSLPKPLTLKSEVYTKPYNTTTRHSTGRGPPAI